MKSLTKSTFRLHRNSDFKHVLVGLLIAGIILVYLFKLWNLSPHVPILYSGDGLSALMSFQNMKSSFWYFETSHLGFPFHQDLRDFPAIADTTNLLISRVLISVTGDINLSFNIQYFASYFTGFLGAYTGARLLRQSPTYAVLIGLIYSFLPFHYLHGASHLYLSSYWTVPVWLAIVIKERIEPGWILNVEVNTQNPFQLFKGSKRTWFLLALSFLFASAGFYYSIFFIMTTGFFGLLTFVQQRSIKNLGLLILSATGSFVIAIQTLPILIFQRSMGPNLEAVRRSLSEVHFYSLQVTKMFLPIRNHRLAPIRNWINSLDPSLQLGEYAEPLGFLLALSLLCLLFIYVFQTKKSDRYPLLTPLAQVELFFLGIAVVGGASYFVAALGFTQIRVWSRVSIVLAFPALLFLFQIADPIVKKLKSKKYQLLILATLVVIQIFDTTPPSLAPDYEGVSKEWNRDKRIASVIENSISPSAKIFQLPVVKFPESPPIFQQADYEHLRMYLHLPTAFFSYGGVKGRQDKWQSQLSVAPEQFFKEIALIGFDAVWIDTRGFEKSPNDYVEYAESEFGPSLIRKENSAFSLYDIREFSVRTKRSMSTKSQEEIRQRLLLLAP